MKTSVRQEADGVVMRLFVNKSSAQEEVVAWERGAEEKFVPTMHESQNGWVLVGDKTGDVVDAAGRVARTQTTRRSTRP